MIVHFKSVGLPGQIGLRGLKGDIGPQGISGLNGIPGRDGEKGDKGFDGMFTNRISYFLCPITSATRLGKYELKLDSETN